MHYRQSELNVTSIKASNVTVLDSLSQVGVRKNVKSDRGSVNDTSRLGISVTFLKVFHRVGIPHENVDLPESDQSRGMTD